MKVRQIVGWTAAFMLCGNLSAKELTVIQLPTARTDGGLPLMKALNEPKSSRSFSKKEITPPVLSGLLWAAWGFNRPAKGGRTAPSAMNWQETQLYVALPEGIYLYNAKDQTLHPVVSGDLRSQLGSQDFVKDTPVNLIFVNDLTKTSDKDPLTRGLYAGVHTGFMAQNVYLYGASEGLGVVIRGSIDSDKIASLLKLPATQKVTFVQSVGYPK